jgi:S-adenosylmethionine synthetase
MSSTLSAPSFVFTSESVTEGHPDKVCDSISDAILDAHLAQDPDAHVAVETLCKAGEVVLAGEVTSRATVDVERIVRDTVRAIGYDDPSQPFCADTLRVTNLISAQAPEIGTAVQQATDAHEKREQGAGDQGIMFGYATDETSERMPLAILLAHRLAEGLARDRRAGTVPWLRPDGKTQVSVRYEDGRPHEVTGVLVSTQHAPDVSQEEIRAYVTRTLVPRELGSWFRPDISIIVNPSGSFVQGGPSADAGVTGRKIIVDTYGGAARHGGGAFSGKDPSKVDRSAAYFCRWAARQVVNAGLARRAEIQVSYAIGHSRPMSVYVDTFGTGDPAAARAHVAQFDFSPARIIEKLELKRPIYRQTTNYGHFGKSGLPWEK